MALIDLRNGFDDLRRGDLLVRFDTKIHTQWMHGEVAIFLGFETASFQAKPKTLAWLFYRGRPHCHDALLLRLLHIVRRS